MMLAVRHRSRSFVLAFGLLGSVGSGLLVGACSSTGSTTSKAGYVKKANAICTEMNTAARALTKPGSSTDELIAFLTKGRTITADALAKLRALTPPKGDEPTVAAIFDGVDKQLGDLDVLVASARGQNQSIMTAAETNLETDSKAVTAAANAYGLTACGTS